MPEITPNVLKPYLQDSFGHGTLTLVTSTLSTPGNWILLRFIHTALSSTTLPSTNVNVPNRPTNNNNNSSNRSIIFHSLIRPSNVWTELGRKLGFDLNPYLGSGRLRYLDGTDYGPELAKATTTTTTATKTTTTTPMLKPIKLEHIAASFNSQLQAFMHQARTASPAAEVTVIIDGLDFVLASQPDVDLVQIQQFIASIRSRVPTASLILTCSADGPLLHNSNNNNNNATRLERTHAALAASLAHQSRWIFQLRPLDTGAAKDVTGILRLSHGGAYEDDGDDDVDDRQDLEETEWLYDLRGDGSVRIWSRGE